MLVHAPNQGEEQAGRDNQTQCWAQAQCGAQSQELEIRT